MRPTIEQYFINMAHLVATRSTCSRRAVGCVLIDKDNHVISTGYNGVPKGAIHCTSQKCDGAKFESGVELDQCRALHAECNAIAHCSNPKNIHAAYVTTSPCMSCMKLLVATGCRLVMASDLYDIEAIGYFNNIGGYYQTILKT